MMLWLTKVKENTEQTEDYETNGNNGRSAGFQRAGHDEIYCLQAKHAGSLRTGRYFRLFRIPSSSRSQSSL